jgi:tetratricopeptide (TPR) repeat protein
MYLEQTLQAAHRAHDLEPEADYIMDTLAEAYYASGNYEQAIFWEKEALKREPDNKFYHAQLKKFEDALGDLKTGQ